MSFRVIHHEGDKDLLVEKVKINADQLKNEFKEYFDFDEHAVDSVVNGNFSDPEIAPLVLHIAINTLFPAISDDCGIGAYEALADRTSGKLAKTLRMFVDGRNFSTGNSGFGDEMTCGYLTSDEVKEFLGLLEAYTPVEEDEEFVDELIDTFSGLVEKKSGDLFIMS